MVRCVVAFGSNLGRREAAVLGAVNELIGKDVRLLRLSSLYETEPVGLEGNTFINAVAVVDTNLGADALLERCHAIETKMGRSGGHFESREIDIDIIAFGELVRKSERLTIPHEAFHNREFVLIPLMEVWPEFECPKTGRSVSELLDDVDMGADIIRISGRSE